MGDVGFSKEFGCVANETEHAAIQSIHEHLSVIGIIGHIPWLLYLAARIPGAAAAYSGFFNWCGDEMDAKIKVCMSCPTAISGLGLFSIAKRGKLTGFEIAMESRATTKGHCVMAGESVHGARRLCFAV